MTPNNELLLPLVSCARRAPHVDDDDDDYDGDSVVVVLLESYTRCTQPSKHNMLENTTETRALRVCIARARSRSSI